MSSELVERITDAAEQATVELAAISGTFTSAGNIVEPLPTGQPPSIPPAPPGVILKVNRIAGGIPAPINPQTTMTMARNVSG